MTCSLYGPTFNEEYKYTITLLCTARKMEEQNLNQEKTKKEVPRNPWAEFF